MKLFIWKKVLTDYTDGVILALADNVEDARKIIIENYSESWGLQSVKLSIYDNEPEVHEEQYSFVLWGGG